MSTTLTTDDLQAIESIVTKVVDNAIEELSLQTAAGFAEVHEKFDTIQDDLSSVKDDLSSVKDDLSSVKDDLSRVKDDLSSVKQTVERIERIQRAEVERVDNHGVAINKIRKVLQAV